MKAKIYFKISMRVLKLLLFHLDNINFSMYILKLFLDLFVWKSLMMQIILRKASPTFLPLNFIVHITFYSSNGITFSKNNELLKKLKTMYKIKYFFICK